MTFPIFAAISAIALFITWTAPPRNFLGLGKIGGFLFHFLLPGSFVFVAVASESRYHRGWTHIAWGAITLYVLCAACSFFWESEGNIRPIVRGLFQGRWRKSAD